MMSNFWNWWIILLTALTLAGTTWLLFSNRSIDKNETEKTTGHVYDGIEEYENPLPAWWFNLFVVSILFAIGYLALYPGLGNFKGFLNWTSHGQWEASVQEAEQKFLAQAKGYLDKPAVELIQDEKALKMGKRIFKAYCTTCHGSDGSGAWAFPNLTDSDWLYGGTEQAITHSITNGRQGAMPAWELMLKNDVDGMVDYVLTLKDGGDANHPQKAQYEMFCATCHQKDGTGNIAFGAPNLADDVWLYGGTKGEIRLSIAKGRQGRMPAHKELLGEERIHLVTAYVMSLSKQQNEDNRE